MQYVTRLTLLGTAVLILLPESAAAQRRATEGDRPRAADWLARCRDERGDDNRERVCEVRELGWRNPGSSMRVDASPNGGVRVEGWDRDSVHVGIRIEAAARTESAAREIARRVRVTRNAGDLEADGPSDLARREWWMVSYEIFVPRRTNLTIETINGPLSVLDVNSRMDLRARNGPLTLRGVGGDVSARAQNGPLTIRLQGTSWDGARLDAETRNGPLVLEVPEGYNAELETGTINGPMTLGFPITVQGRIGAGARQHFSTTLGRGGARIRAVTTNGPAVIRRS
jgi:hypothetical protein